MTTTVIIVLFLMILGSIVRGIYLENDSDFGGLYIMSIIILSVFMVVLIIEANSKSTEVTSKQLVTPKIKVESETINNKIVKSDTTYIYTFKRE